MMLIRRVGGPTVTERGEYRVWLTGQPWEVCRRRFLKLARAKDVKRLRISLDENAATLTFVSSGDHQGGSSDDRPTPGRKPVDDVRWLDRDPRRSADEMDRRRTEHARLAHRRLEVFARRPRSRPSHVSDVK